MCAGFYAGRSAQSCNNHMIEREGKNGRVTERICLKKRIDKNEGFGD